MSERISTINVVCQCSATLFRYQKVGKGRLIKCFVDRILVDHVGIPKNVGLEVIIPCPVCKNRVGTTKRIHGKVAVKLNQGQIKGIRI